jgi:two-component system sensor histidine kinase DesK
MNLDETRTRVPGVDVPPDPPGWVHFIWLIYLGFLFMPVVTTPHDSRWLWPTLCSIPVFLILYVRAIRTFRRGDRPEAGGLLSVLMIAVMGYALALVNDSANTYLIYCVAVAPFVVSTLRRVGGVTVLLLGGYALEQLMLGFRPVLVGITTVVGIAAAASNYMLLENRRKNLALRRSSEEVQRLARVAERERIGRDLHDLLGHTLSLIAIKSELAAKLLERDRVAAAREVADVTNIAREALKQVRTAVSGIRAAALEGELASARLLLETTGVALTYEHDGALLPAEVETTLAMIVREAVTNIQRHAGARRALIRVSMDERAGVGGGGVGAGLGGAGFGGPEPGAAGAAGTVAGGAIAGGAGVDGAGTGAIAGGAAAGVGAGTAGYGKAVLLYVSDDGRGGITQQGNGLSGIAERVKSLNGTLHIESPRGKGSVLCVRLPLGHGPSTGPAPSSLRLEQVDAVRAPSAVVSGRRDRGGAATVRGEAQGGIAAVFGNARGGAATAEGDARGGVASVFGDVPGGAATAGSDAQAEVPLVSTATVVQT